MTNGQPMTPWPGAPAPVPVTRSVSLRWRVMLLAMSMVVMAVVLMAFAVYAVVARALYDDLDNQLQSRVKLLIESGSLEVDPGKAIEGTAYSDVNAMLVIPGQMRYTATQTGQTLPVGPPEQGVIDGKLRMSLRTVDQQRVLAIRLSNDRALVISKSLEPTNQVLRRLTTVLLIVGGIGVAVAAIAGGMVASAGLRPVARLTQAAERVARTDDLRPIPVFGSDELARLTEAFNMMLRALAESRERQARLVTDAGHELRTPLTSLRTNVELLMVSMEPGRPRLPEHEMADLRADVLGQIEELSTLVGDLVDLTREDAGGVIHEIVEMSEVIDRSLERVRRRRNDIEFDVATSPWRVYGDAAGLARAVLNLLDNAAKWSPPGAGRRQPPADRLAARRTGRRRSGTGDPTDGAGLDLRAVLPVGLRARDAGIRSGTGDRAAGGAQARRLATGRGHRSGRAAAGHGDARGAARSAGGGRYRTVI